MQLAVFIPPDRLEGILKELQSLPGELNRELSTQINATAREGRKLIVASLFKGTTLQQKLILRRVSQRSRATPSNLEAKLAVKGNPVGLNQFAFSYDRDSKSGVLVRLTRSQTVELHDAFVGVGPRGKAHILRRAGSRARLTQAHYQPNLGKVRQTVATQRGRSLIQLIEVEPQLLAEPMKQIAAVLLRKSADAMDRVLSRGRVGKAISGSAIRGIQKQYG